MENNIKKIGTGLNTDSQIIYQTDNDLLFCLNGVNKFSQNNIVKQNDESNSICAELPASYTPIGTCFINNNKTLIFSVSIYGVSEIGIQNDNCNYITIVNDSYSLKKDKLNFDINYQIQATYRLRNGCDEMVYFTDNYNNIRHFNISKLNDYKLNNKWIASKFDLIAKSSTIPKIENIEVVENQGSLTPGSYTIFVQQLDKDYNTTKFVELINNINIVNDNLNNRFFQIQGSTNIDIKDIQSPATNKAIKISFDKNSFDKNYTYFRLAICSYTSGIGLLTDVKYTSVISNATTNYLYTGNNFESLGTINDLLLNNQFNDIHTAGTIEQIDNKLVIGNIKGKTYNYCKLQKYASKIKADVVVDTVILSSVEEERNSKNPFVNTNGLSHQPGDIYSYGIVYVFDDMLESPVYHIPGKNNNIADNVKFINQPNVYPLSNINNKNTSEYYINQNDCDDNDYWGLDSEGETLVNKNVRHHKFPTREELGLGFVTKKASGNTTNEFKKLIIQLDGNLLENSSLFTLKVTYNINGNPEEFFSDVITNISYTNIFESNLFLNTDVINNIQLFSISQDTIPVILNIPLTNDESSLQSNGLTYKVSLQQFDNQIGTTTYTVPIMGIAFSNVILPTKEEIGGTIIGYKIVRQERKQTDKNILDSAVALPMTLNNPKEGTTDESKFISASIIVPKVNSVLGYRVPFSQDTFNLLTPSHKFQDKTFDDFETIEEVGKYQVLQTGDSGFLIKDVFKGSSADGIEKLSDNTKDTDGYALKHLVKTTEVEYVPSNDKRFTLNNLNSSVYNLEPVSSALHPDKVTEIVNLSCDNKNLIVATTEYIELWEGEYPSKNYPYVYIKKQNLAPYSNFRINPYYSTDSKLYTENTCKIFSGDTHIVPYRHSNHIYGGAINGTRLKETSLLSYAVAVLLIIAAVAVSIITFGAAAPASVAAITLAIGAIAVAAGAVVNVVAGQVSTKKFADIYQEKWKKGLQFTLFDMVYQSVFYDSITSRIKEQADYKDDTFKWFGEVIGDFWFETQLNLSLRVNDVYNNENYLLPLTTFSTNKPKTLDLLKKTAWNKEKRDGRDPYLYYVNDTIEFDTPEENYFARKILYFKDNKWEYLGLSTPILFMLNPDLSLNTKLSKYYLLPLEYDCCSDCKEVFPNRWYWSEESFQEDLFDNYKVFRSNNYKDISSETGEITNMFKYNNSLFIHTQTALYKIPTNLQEKITSELSTYIGTGAFGELPEQKIIDVDNGNSAGCTHKFALLKTPYGLFFPSEKERKMYQFDGNQLKVINGNLNNYFEKNMPLNFIKEYYNNTGNNSFDNNPSNTLGIGYIGVYDTVNQRILYTKKDFSLQLNGLSNSDYKLIVNDNVIMIFYNYNNTIQTEKIAGWKYLGIVNSQMKFEKDEILIVTEMRNNTPKQIQLIKTSYKTIDSTVFTNYQKFDMSWTLSYCLVENKWSSFHSFLPNLYIFNNNSFYSWISNNNKLWKHNTKNHYLSYYNKQCDYILEFTYNKNPLVNKSFNALNFHCDVLKYNKLTDEYYAIDNLFFDKLIAYNSKQATGVLDIKVKNNHQDEDYLIDQMTDFQTNEIIVDRNENDWSINELRNAVSNYQAPMFISNNKSLQNDYFIDKIINQSVINFNTDWYESESMTDKYLVVRLIFNSFVANNIDVKNDVKILLNFSEENVTESYR